MRKGKGEECDGAWRSGGGRSVCVCVTSRLRSSSAHAHAERRDRVNERSTGFRINVVSFK